MKAYAIKQRLQQPFSHEKTVSIQLLDQVAPPRVEVERFIADVFASAYGAEIRHFLPWLLVLQNGLTEPLAALGIRPAANGPLFLEQYLTRPIENVLAQQWLRPIDRGGVVEVGNLASRRSGAAQLLFLSLTAYLWGAAYEWVVFTATSQVRNSFARLGLKLEWLADANPACLRKGAQDWGSYYQQQPQVVAGNVKEGAAYLASQLDADLAPIWQAALLAGRTGGLSKPATLLATELAHV